MWSGKKKKGSAEDFFKEEELDLELSGGRKKDKDKDDGKDKRKKDKDDGKKKRDDDAKDTAHSGVGLFQRKHKKSVGSSDIDNLRKDREKEKEREREKEKEKEKGGRVFHRRNKSSSSTSGDPSAAAVVASAASRLNVLGGSNPDRDVTRLGIKRETFSPPGTLNLNSGLLSSYPPPTTSPRGTNSPRNPLGNSAGTHSGPMAALPQLADVSHKRKNSVDEVSPRFEGSPMRGLADMKQPIPIYELLKRSPITSPRSPVLGRELTEQQRQILAQAKKKLHLELVRDNLGLVDRGSERPIQPSNSSDDLKREIATILEEWDDDQDAEKERCLRDKQEKEEWERERRAKLAHLSHTSEPKSALGQYLVTRWKDSSQQPRQAS